LEADPNYSLTIDQLARFLSACKESGYVFNNCLLFGGEPLLWENLLTGLLMIRNSGVFKYVGMITNAKRILKVCHWTLMSHLDFVIVSKYNDNVEQLEFLLERFPDKVFVQDGTNFRCYTDKPNVEYLPADCACPSMSLYGDEFSACSLIRQLLARHGRNSWPTSTRRPVEPGFMSYMDLSHNYEICQYCLGNRKVRKGSTKCVKNQK